MNFYTCPVCAYPEMSDPIEEGNICPCCGTEFGYDDDLGVTYRQLRDLWINGGMTWFSPVRRPAADWSPVRQLVDADYEFTFDWPDSEPLTEFEGEVCAATLKPCAS
jgi:hypothetical protein